MSRLLLLCLLGGFLPAAELQVAATVPWEDLDGWTPVVLTITSPVPTRVEVTARHGTAEAQVVFDVGPGPNPPRTLLVPSRPELGGSINVHWRAAGLDPGEVRTSATCGHRDVDVVLLDPDDAIAVKALHEAVEVALKMPPQNPHQSSAHVRGSGTYPEDRFRRITADGLPSRWQGYPLWLTLVTTPAGERRLDLTQRQAIAAWTRAGGALFVSDARQLAPWRALGARVALFRHQDVIIRLGALAGLNTFTPDRLAPPGTGGLPAVGFTLIAVLFALLAGPGAFWWASRRGQRALVLLAVPVLSAATCLVLIVYGVVADGLGVRRVVVQGLILDQTTGRGMAATAVGVFAGLSPGAFPVDPDDRLMPYEPRLFGRNAWEMRDEAREVVITADGKAAGWVPARRNVQLLAVRPVADRRRLVFTRQGQAWKVLNGFDQPLTALTWGGDGTTGLWQLGAPLAPGAEALLIPGMAIMTLPRKELGQEWQLELYRQRQSQSIEAPLPGTYTATFAAPLVPPPGPTGVDLAPPITVVLGRTQAETAP